MILALLLFLTNFDGLNGFVGQKPILQKTLTSSLSRPFNAIHRRQKQTPLSKVGVQKDQSSIRQTELYAIPASIRDAFPVLGKSLFSYAGNVPISQAFVLNVLLFVGLRAKLLKMLTAKGFFHALALATGLWTTLGWRGWTTCVLYLFLGSAVTKVKFQEKEKLGIAEGRGGRRGPENVWGSAATGLACAICSAQGPKFLGISSDLYILGYVASLATKLSDTFASEIGKAYGKTTFLITTLERVAAGTEGAVSAEGTAASVVGGALISLFGFLIGFLPPKAVPISIFAAFVATNIESVLGATLQGKKNLEWMTNEVINFINTLTGAAIAIVCGKLFL